MFHITYQALACLFHLMTSSYRALRGSVHMVFGLPSIPSTHATSAYHEERGHVDVQI